MKQNGRVKLGFMFFDWGWRPYENELGNLNSDRIKLKQINEIWLASNNSVRSRYSFVFVKM